MGYDSAEFNHCKVIDPKLDVAGKPSTNPLVMCVHCLNKFSAGAYRFRGHIMVFSLLH